MRARHRHWLLFDAERRIMGCHCGYRASEADDGWGDSLVDHFEAVTLRRFGWPVLLLAVGALLVVLA